MIIFDEYDTTSVEIDTTMLGTVPPLKIPINGTVLEKSAFEIFKQRKVKGKRGKIWKEKL